MIARINHDASFFFLLNTGFHGRGSNINDLHVKQIITNASILSQDSVDNISHCQISKLMRHGRRNMGSPMIKFQLDNHLGFFLYEEIKCNGLYKEM